jgi:hypothetical protein
MRLLRAGTVGGMHAQSFFYGHRTPVAVALR